MKLFSKNLLIALIALTTVFTACEEDVTPEAQTLDKVLAANGFTVLSAALSQANLTTALQGNSKLTIFAPTDAAFADAGITASNVSTVANLESILLYHVVAGEVRSSDLTDGDVETLNGKFVSIDATNLKVNEANIASPFDVEADNGVIHTIDAVLLPSTNIVETALATPSLSILVDILGGYPEILDALSAESADFTVFAPTNDAFVALLAAIGQTSVDDIPEDVIESILYYHVLGSAVRSASLSDGLMAETLSGEEITVTQSGDDFLIAGAGIALADVETSNGVVHVVNSVLVPPSIGQFVNTIVEPAYFNKNFTTLVAAVKAASPSILETLLGAGPSGNGMTLFAPTNDAFAAAGITALPDQATLDAVLAYHLIDGTILASGLPETSAAAPATIGAVGGNFYLSNKGTGVFINGNTQVIATDIDPSEGAGNANGVVHVINRTLLPPSNDIVQLAIDGGYSSLAAALIEAGLVSTLQGDGPFTVFAPTDAAFDALYTALSVAGPDEIDDALLEDVLLYHVLGLKAFSSDLIDGLTAATASDANGQNPTTLLINITDGAVTITDNNEGVATITAVNILGTNGVIHEINKVILP
jgi:transforming growth factor-beta-induced protein